MQQFPLAAAEYGSGQRAFPGGLSQPGAIQMSSLSDGGQDAGQGQQIDLRELRKNL